MHARSWALSALLLAAASGCSCGSDGAVAEISALQGAVDADDVDEAVAWRPTVVGRRFVVGEAVRTGPNATCDLTLAGGGSLHVDPDSIVRFARDANGAAPLDVDVEQGSTTLEAPADAPLEIETVFGVAHLDAHTRTRIGPRASRFEVVVGHATLDRAGSAPLVLDIGGSVDRTGRPATPPPTTVVPATRVAVAPPVARRSVDVHGASAQILAPGQGEYVALADGRAQVDEGSTLRTGRGTTIDIATADGRIHVDTDSEVQLSASGARAARGTFSLEGSGATRLEVPGGAIVLSPDGGPSRATVALERGGNAEVTVLAGSVTEESADGPHVLHAEQDDTSAVVETPTATAPVTLSAGDSVVVHDPNAPTRVRIDAPSGCTEAAWRVDGHTRPSASNGTSLVTELRLGAHRYQLVCGSGERSRGTVRVDRDRGVASMPRTAPRTVVDADGRPYSVLYQTLLPEILFRWPHASTAGPYVIEIQRGGSTRRIPSSAASHTFASGEVGEGTTTLTFRAADGTHSLPTPVHIRFDNATPIASIRTPAPGAALVGTQHVEGTVAEGATVSVSGAPLSVDHSERFASDVAVPSDGCLAIRVALSGRGVHYYVRCGATR